MKIMEKCNCKDCETEINKSTEAYYYDKEENIICWDCFYDSHGQRCPLCDEDFLNYDQVHEVKMFLSIEAAKENSCKPGFYKAKNFPIFRACLIGGFEKFYMDNLSLVRDCDVNSMFKTIHGMHFENIYAGEVCQSCWDTYALKKSGHLFTNYVVKRSRIHLNINHRGANEKGYGVFLNKK